MAEVIKYTLTSPVSTVTIRRYQYDFYEQDAKKKKKTSNKETAICETAHQLI